MWNVIEMMRPHAEREEYGWYLLDNGDGPDR
jgi:hypothetical protein